MQGQFRPPVLLLCGFVSRLVHVRHGLHVSLAVYARNCCVLPRSSMLFRITDINVVTEKSSTLSLSHMMDRKLTSI